MILKKCVFLLLIFIFYKVYAVQEEGLSVQGQSRAKAINNPYFWKVEKDGKISHFLGTVHSPISIRELSCSKTIQHHVRNSDLVFVENNYLSDKHREFVEAHNQLKVSRDGREFQALSKKSQEFLRSRGVSEQLNLYGYTGVLHSLCKYGVDNIVDLILTSQVTNIADSNNTPIQELNSNKHYDRVLRKKRENANAYNRLSDVKFSLEVAFLNGDINNFSQRCPPQWHVDMMEHYMSGKIDEYIEIAWSHITPEQRRSNDLEMQERNLEWLDHFEEAQKSYGHIFLVGGVDHFIGPSSFINMLKDKGYVVELVTCEN